MGTGIELRDLGLDRLSGDTVHETMPSLGWEVVGRGHFATVWGRSDMPGVVVRTSGEMDGWFVYGVAAMRGDLEDCRHAPLVHDVALLEDDGYVALTERLRPASGPKEEAVVAAAGRICSRHLDDVDAASMALLDGRHPGFRSFVVETMWFLGKHHLDPRDGNLLFAADGRLVVNDPCGTVLAPDVRRVLEDGPDPFPGP